MAKVKVLQKQIKLQDHGVKILLPEKRSCHKDNTYIWNIKALSTSIQKMAKVQVFADRKSYQNLLCPRKSNYIDIDRILLTDRHFWLLCYLSPPPRFMLLYFCRNSLTDWHFWLLCYLDTSGCYFIYSPPSPVSCCCIFVGIHLQIDISGWSLCSHLNYRVPEWYICWAVHPVINYAASDWTEYHANSGCSLATTNQNSC